MKSRSASALAGLSWVYSLGCASAPHAVPSRAHEPVIAPIYLAQANCTQWDSTMVCCIKNHPANPVDACGAAAWEIAEVLQGLKMVNEAAQAAKSEAVPEENPDEKWREQCRTTYVQCVDQKKPRWVGPCYDCFRYCEGQRQWPFDRCYPGTK